MISWSWNKWKGRKKNFWFLEHPNLILIWFSVSKQTFPMSFVRFLNKNRYQTPMRIIEVPRWMKELKSPDKYKDILFLKFSRRYHLGYFCAKKLLRYPSTYYCLFLFFFLYFDRSSFSASYIHITWIEFLPFPRKTTAKEGKPPKTANQSCLYMLTLTIHNLAPSVAGTACSFFIIQDYAHCLKVRKKDHFNSKPYVSGYVSLSLSIDCCLHFQS